MGISNERRPAKIFRHDIKTAEDYFGSIGNRTLRVVHQADVIHASCRYGIQSYFLMFWNFNSEGRIQSIAGRYNNAPVDMLRMELTEKDDWHTGEANLAYPERRLIDVMKVHTEGRNIHPYFLSQGHALVSQCVDGLEGNSVKRLNNLRPGQRHLADVVKNRPLFDSLRAISRLVPSIQVDQGTLGIVTYSEK